MKPTKFEIMRAATYAAVGAGLMMSGLLLVKQIECVTDSGVRVQRTKNGG